MGARPRLSTEWNHNLSQLTHTTSIATTDTHTEQRAVSESHIELCFGECASVSGEMIVPDCSGFCCTEGAAVVDGRLWILSDFIRTFGTEVKVY